MTERRERTPEEREAARLERARRRAGGVFNEPETTGFVPPPLAVDYADVESGDAAEPEVAEPAFEAPGSEPAFEAPGSEPAFEDHEPEPAELPSGTRRVSHQDRLAARPPRSPRQRRHPPRVRGGHSRVRRIVALIALLAAGALAWFLVQLFQPFGTSPHGRVTVVIPAHATSKQIGSLLEREGVIASSFFFELRATLAGDRGELRSGTYRLQLGMSYSAVLSALTVAPPAAKTSELTITEGHTRQYIARLLHQQGVRGDYLAATRRSPLLDPRRYGAPRHVASLEGFLFPDTFQLVDPIRMSALVADQLRDFKARFATVDLRYAHSRRLSDYDVLKIASLVEGEAATPASRPLVASVIYNRLRDGMMLQMDSTTRYATGNFTRPLTASQLSSRSPYNTRTHFGLPPTPIDSPGLAAIRAAAHPARTHYLYFFAKPCTDQTVFASSYAEFQHLLAADYRPHCGKG